jgi:hypothetical protein
MTILIICAYNLNAQGAENLEKLRETMIEAIELTTYFWIDEVLEVEIMSSPSPAIGFFAIDDDDLNISLEKVHSGLASTFCQWGMPVEFLKVEPYRLSQIEIVRNLHLAQ